MRPAVLPLISLFIILPATASDALEELLVTGNRDYRTLEVVNQSAPAADAARLLLQAPGANINNNGPLTGIAQYRGMYGDRVAVSVEGRSIGGAGPNAMDTPLSYASGQMDSIILYRGIAPVSVAQESIGGALEAHAAQVDFSDGDSLELSGQLRADAQSAHRGFEVGGVVFGTNQHHRFKAGGVYQNGDDARFPSGKITPSEYQRQRADLAYGFRNGAHQIDIDYGHTETGNTGTAALPMDIQWIDGDLTSLGYQLELANNTMLRAKVYGNDLSHGMTNYHLRAAPVQRSAWRRNVAKSRNWGMAMDLNRADDSGRWTLGLDGFDTRHDSDIDNPNMPTFFVVNFNDARRRVLGLFAERQQQLGDSLQAEFGLRYNRVDMDANEVDGTPANMMPPAGALRDAFNTADRAVTDHNVDAVLRLNVAATDSLAFYLGLGRKTRSPSYQERYLWLPLEATGGLADGNTYTGNLQLEPEVAHEVELGLDVRNHHWTLAPRVFYRDVEDYIQGTPSDLMPALMMVRMMNTSNGTSRPDPLQFNNVDARLWGLDMDWAWHLGTRWSLSGLVNYVRGERRDIDDNLYRIAPPNASLGLNYQGRNWQARLESVAYAAQDNVSVTNREKTTPGYGVVNVSADWQLTPTLQMAAGVENLLDRDYRAHTGGYNRATNSDVPIGQRLPAYGANGYLRLTWTF